MAPSCIITLRIHSGRFTPPAHLQRGGQRGRDGGRQRLQAVHVAHHPQDARKLEGPPHHLLGIMPCSGCGASTPRF